MLPRFYIQDSIYQSGAATNMIQGNGKLALRCSLNRRVEKPTSKATCPIIMSKDLLFSPTEETVQMLPVYG
jgi:hypothetical protein